MKYLPPNPLLPLALGLWILYGAGVETIFPRAMLEIDGTIIESQDTPLTRGPRYSTEYTFETLSDKSLHYRAGATDASLPRSMPIGTRIIKHKGELSYERNDQTIEDLSLGFYGTALSLAFLLILWSAWIWRHKGWAGRKESRLNTP